MSTLKYHKKQIKLNNILSFWTHFNEDERFLFYNPQNKEFILGAKRLKSFSIRENPKDCLYAFSAMTFFDSIKDEKWAGFGNETITFEYYLVEKDGKQTLYYLNNPIEIENSEVEVCKHNYSCQSASDDYEKWEKLFSVVHRAITAKQVNKVVISREIKIECDTLIKVESILQNLLNKNVNSFVFAYFKDGKTFLGATPEILVQKDKDNILSYALAGTAPRDDKNDELQKTLLLADAKNRHEHRIVVDSIVEVMKKYASELIIGETSILTLRNLHHLRALIRAKDKNSTLLTWARRLHPTPALGGNPVDKALALIKSHEQHERGLYAAPIGVMDGNGDGVFVVAIRSALIHENVAFAYAGCGIVDKSDCEIEYKETENKLKTITESL